MEGSTYYTHFCSLKSYFDDKGRFDEILHCIQSNIDVIQYIHCHVFHEVLFNTDAGYETSHKIEKLRNVLAEQEYVFYNHHESLRYTPYDIRYQPDKN